MKSIESLLRNTKRKTLLAIFPHPDDESMMSGGLLNFAKQNGWKTVVVTLTCGGAGRLYTHPKGKTIKEIRIAELKRAVKILNANELVIGDFDDGKLLKQTRYWKAWLCGLIKKYQPGIVVTYDPSGMTGHPDHIALSSQLRELTCENYFVEFEPPILLWATFPKNLKSKLVDTFIHPDVAGVLTEPTHVLSLGWKWTKKWRALRAYRSQNLSRILPLPLFMLLALNPFEWYHRVTPGKKYSYLFVDYKLP